VQEKESDMLEREQEVITAMNGYIGECLLLPETDLLSQCRSGIRSGGSVELSILRYLATLTMCVLIAENMYLTSRERPQAVRVWSYLTWRGNRADIDCLQPSGLGWVNRLKLVSWRLSESQIYQYNLYLTHDGEHSVRERINPAQLYYHYNAEDDLVRSYGA
jgi:hypothetical protein